MISSSASSPASAAASSPACAPASARNQLRIRFWIAVFTKLLCIFQDARCAAFRHFSTIFSHFAKSAVVLDGLHSSLNDDANESCLLLFVNCTYKIKNYF